MSQEDEKIAALEAFARKLSAALTLDLTIGAGCDIDVEAVLDLASVAAHTVMRPAAPLTTFLVGFAAGQASATSAPDAATAFVAASHTARQVASDHQTAGGSS